MSPDTAPTRPSVLTAAWQPDPYPFYATLARAHATTGLYLDPETHLWVACTPAAAQAALQAPALGVRPADEPVPRALQGRPSGAVFGGLMRMNDGAARHAAPKARAQRQLADWGHRVPAAVQAVTGLGLRPGERPINELLFDAPLATIAVLLGCAPREAIEIAADARRLVAAWALQADEPARARGDAAAARLLARFDHDANRVGLLTQTCDATAGLLGNTIVAWRGHADAACDPAALVQQTARTDPAIHHTRRFAHADTRLCGHEIRRGDGVLVLLVHPGLGFGHDRHACPGEALAQQVVTALLAHWLAPPGDIAMQRLRAPTARWRYRPLPNARIPEFLTASDERPH
jgi:cytochrome P450